MKKHIKTIVFLFFIILIKGHILGQTDTEFAPIGAEWYYEIGNEDNIGMGKQFVVDKDTIVDGKTCRLIYGDNIKEIVYEENGSVFYFFKNQFRKIYDFSVYVGDTVEFELKTAGTIDTVNWTFHLDTIIILPCRIDSISTKIIDGVALREISANYIYHEEGFPGLHWTYQHVYLEKVGVEFQIFNDGIFPVCPDYATFLGNYCHLRCYHDSDIEYITDWWQQKDKPCDFLETDINEIKKELDNSITIFPNPAKDKLNIQFPKNFNSEYITIAIYDKIGKFVSGKEYFSEPEIIIDISNLTAGCYFVKINNNKNNKVLTHKFIKL